LPGKLESLGDLGSPPIQWDDDDEKIFQEIFADLAGQGTVRRLLPVATQALVDDLAADAGAGVRSEATSRPAGPDGSQGGGTSNTPPTNRQEVAQSKGTALVRGGLDWLKVSCYGRWKRDRLPALQAALEAAKLKSQGKEGTGTIDGADGDLLVVGASGVRKKGLHFAWLFDWQGITFLVSSRGDEHDTLPNVVVDIPSLVLMRWGHVRAWQEVKRLLAGLGFELSRAVPGRADPCADLADRSARDLWNLCQAGQCVRRAKKWNLYGEGDFTAVQTLNLGKSGVKMRAYEKVQELQAKGNAEAEEKWDLLVAQRWGKEVRKALRVEFQVDRECLRDQFRVNTVEELFAKLGAIVEWLTLDWVRITAEPPDRANGHERRGELHPLWNEVRAAFAEWTGPAGEAVEPRERKIPKREPLWRSLLGCLTSIAVEAGQAVHSTEQLYSWATGELAKRIDDDALEDWWAKSLVWQAKGPGRGLAWSDAIPF